MLAYSGEVKSFGVMGIETRMVDCQGRKPR